MLIRRKLHIKNIEAVNKVDLQTLPDLLTALNGESIITAEQWKRIRRPELIDLFREHVYGREPVERPEFLKFYMDKQDSVMNGKAVRKKIRIEFNGPGGEGTINLIMFVPTNIPKPVPIFLMINIRSVSNTDPERIIKSPFWPVENMIDRGYAAAVFHVSDVAPDKENEFKNGVHGIFDPPGITRPSNAWGTIAAWAWGARRVMDYFENDSDIDIKRVAIVGHSRGGKAALWCGALDERFALVVSNNSGSTGAAISRGKKGENIRSINTNFPYWFCDNYKKYNDREHALPIDQHMLIALMAPRLVYVASATEDEWAAPESEFLSCVYSEPVYRLFDLIGLGTQTFPSAGSSIHNGNIGYHLRTGEHDMTLYDWNCYMDYADRFMI